MWHRFGGTCRLHLQGGRICAVGTTELLVTANYRVAAQLVALRVVLSSIELVGWLVS
jgi:hypothetical protein